MTTVSDEPTGSQALVALTEMGCAVAEQPTPAELDQGLNCLFDRIAVGKARRRGLVRWSVIGATAVLALVVGMHAASLSLKRLPSADPLSLAYQIEGGSVLEGGYLRESGHAGIKLLFNEGSQFMLRPGTRGWVRELDKKGARVAIERGEAVCQVTHSRDRRWLVEAGPFLVTVKGTAFTTSWDPLSEEFELRLRHGRVVISGPVSGGEITLRAGQRLRVNLSKAETLITEEKPVVSNFGAPTSLPATTPDLRPSVERDSPTGLNPFAAPAPSAVAKRDGERGWAEALASGQWDRILDDAKRAGLQTTLSKASSEDLFALANAARYRRRTDLARAALLAERRRFPDSPRALDAVYLLGRVEESREPGTARAIAWYDEYLARAPRGAFAAEALGRKMTLTNEREGPAQAQPIAEEYLRRFPKGSYAGSARALRRVP